MSAERARPLEAPTSDVAERPPSPVGGLAALLTTAQVAELLVISERTVKRLGIPHFKVGRQVRYDRRSVNRWLEARKEQ